MKKIMTILLVACVALFSVTAFANKTIPPNLQIELDKQDYHAAVSWQPVRQDICGKGNPYSKWISKYFAWFWTDGFLGDSKPCEVAELADHAADTYIVEHYNREANQTLEVVGSEDDYAKYKERLDNRTILMLHYVKRRAECAGARIYEERLSKLYTPRWLLDQDVLPDYACATDYERVYHNLTGDGR